MQHMAARQAEGRNKLAALREASLTRLRPVLMTSAATVFGHLPLVFVSGPGSEARNSIGTVLVSGMTIGTVFTLFVVPVFYSPRSARRPRGRPMLAVCRRPGRSASSARSPALL